MENRTNVKDQNTQQIGSNSIDPPVIYPKKPKTNYLLVGGIVLVCFIIFGFGGYYLGKRPLKQSATGDQNQTTQQVSLSDPTANWKTYTNTELKFSLKYPNTWNQGEEKLTTGNMIVLTPSSVHQIGNQIQAVNIYAQTNPNQLTSLEYYNQNIKSGQEGSVCTNPVINSNIPASIRNLDITIIEGTCGILSQGPRTIIAHNGILVDISSSFVKEIDNNLIYQILSTFKILDQNPVSSEKINSTEITYDCYIKVKTTNKEILLNTSWKNIGSSSKCYQHVKNIWSPSGQYAAFEDISGGIDSQIRVFALTQNNNQSHNLDVLGTSTVIDLIFLPNDKLAVLNGFPNETDSYRLLIYDLPNLYKDYPNNLERGVDLFSNLEQIKNIIKLSDKGKKYNVMSVSNGKLLIHETQGIDTPPLQEYSINTL